MQVPDGTGTIRGVSSRLAYALTAIAALALVTAGCDNGSSDATTTAAPPPSTSDDTGTQPEPTQARVRVYLVRDEKVGVAERAVTGPAVLRGALQQLFEGPTPEEQGWGLSTAVPAGVEVRSVSIADGTATIDLSGAFDDGGGSAGMFLRLAQLVHTATQFPSVDRVALRIEGEPVKVFSSEGIELPETLTRADVEEQAPAILVEQPAPGSRIVGPLRIAGTANTFEATLSWEVVAADGSILGSGFATATCGTGCRGSFAVVEPIEGSGPATLRVFERSAEDGSETKVVEVPIELG